MTNSKAAFMSVTQCFAVVDELTQETLSRIEFNITIGTTEVPPQFIPAEAIINPSDSSASIRRKMLDAIKAAVLSQMGITLVDTDIVMPTFTIGAGAAPAETRSDNYVGAANGETIDTSLSPLSRFSLNVAGVNGIALSWEVVLEGSLDGITFSTILTHTQLAVGLGLTISSGGNSNPSLYIRSRCISVSLGSASAIKATILGIP